uniref:RRM domain-containing protein n=1 Tax=Chromera velia CCMP2878 TaxID=1169474 RepID=A0A0G4I8L6_9ALVE|eukprot:Cvel_1989.t1-p1 / transcript=Cvel_1989.t1 / gene=Cvel_1989 / organism=Chromera_velia_CCMP2878 / gene_product=hypothetical protein / transcript_product=hypothetical protein / location=Cvel_scaffold75:147917-149653(+) / protein_length=144 / sequence_SO=supercontig / SO=protein_coding / is_pseudo=false
MFAAKPTTTTTATTTGSVTEYNAQRKGLQKLLKAGGGCNAEDKPTVKVTKKTLSPWTLKVANLSNLTTHDELENLLPAPDNVTVVPAKNPYAWVHFSTKEMADMVAESFIYDPHADHPLKIKKKYTNIQEESESSSSASSSTMH